MNLRHTQPRWRSIEAWLKVILLITCLLYEKWNIFFIPHMLNKWKLPSISTRLPLSLLLDASEDKLYRWRKAASTFSRCSANGWPIQPYRWIQRYQKLVWPRLELSRRLTFHICSSVGVWTEWRCGYSASRVVFSIILHYNSPVFWWVLFILFIFYSSLNALISKLSKILLEYHIIKNFIFYVFGHLRNFLNRVLHVRIFLT